MELQEDKDFGYWGVDFHSYASRARELGMFLDRRPVLLSLLPQKTCLMSAGEAPCTQRWMFIGFGCLCKHNGLQPPQVCLPCMPI